jgi:hypothetical protein
MTATMRASRCFDGICVGDKGQCDVKNPGHLRTFADICPVALRNDSFDPGNAVALGEKYF